MIIASNLPRFRENGGGNLKSHPSSSMKPICELGLFSLSRSFRNCTLNHWRLRWFYKYNTYDTYYIIYAYIYIPYLLPQLPIFLALNSQLQDRRIYIYTCILNVYMFQCKRLSLTYPQKEAKLKMDCAKKISSNLSQLFLVQENLAFLFSRFLVFGGCKTKKKTRWSLYKSHFFVSIKTHGVSPSFCVRLFPLPVLVGCFFWGGDPTQKPTTTEGHRNTQKLLLVALGKELFQTNQGPSLGFANDGRYVCWYLCKYIYMYVCLCVSKDLYDICLYLSIYLYIYSYIQYGILK